MEKEYSGLSQRRQNLLMDFEILCPKRTRVGKNVRESTGNRRLRLGQTEVLEFRISETSHEKFTDSRAVTMSSIKAQPHCST